MINAVVVGLQWGDEGKGKIVDYLSENFDIVTRFQGGNNAGHTICINDKIFKLNLLPSCILRKDKIAIIGNGVVINPIALMEEVNDLISQGIEINENNLLISEEACMLLDVHIKLDELSESSKNKDKKIGTTKKGIGPCYADKAHRRALKMYDLYDLSTLKNKISELFLHHSMHLNIPRNEIEELSTQCFSKLQKIHKDILKFIKPTWKFLNENNGKKNILFEGAQGGLLDVDHGTYPFVTSSNTIASQAYVGSGMPFNSIDHSIGVLKTYTTRVGEGPFPSEQINPIGEKLQNEGKEKGTVTGRSRRCGWLDLAVIKKNLIMSNPKYLVLTKIDVLDSLKEIKICTGYECNGKQYDHLPSDPAIISKLTSIYETLPGWLSQTAGLKQYSDMPENAKNYIKFIENLLAIPIKIISTGPCRSDTINK